MAKAQQPPNPFDQLHPADGYRAEAVSFGAQMSVFVKLLSRGVLRPALPGMADPSVEVHEIKSAVPADVGRHLRAVEISQALCRYFNSAGDWDELHDILNKMRPVLVGGLLVPGWHFVDHWTDTEGAHVYLFKADDRDEYVRWEEDVCIETGLTDADVREIYAGPLEQVHPFRGAAGATDSAEAAGDAGETRQLCGPDVEGGSL